MGTTNVPNNAQKKNVNPSVGGNHALRGIHLVAVLEAVAVGVHGGVAVLALGILAEIQEPIAARRVRHLTAVGVVVHVPVGVHLAVGDAVGEGVLERVQRGVQAREPVDQLGGASPRTTVVGVGAALGADVDGQSGQQGEGDEDAHRDKRWTSRTVGDRCTTPIV